VVTYNIRYGEAIDRAIEELQSPQLPGNAEVLLLQEMDLTGVQRIAEALGMNYAFAPASIHTYHDRQFGNAVLSRWPIVDAQKIILPHNHPLTNQMRTATRVTLDMGEFELPVYSVHTETIMTPPGHRHGQFAALVADVSPAADYVIVGGDFNTVTAGQVDDLAELMAQARLLHASAGSGPTVARYNVPAQADHIFSKGFEVVDAGVMDGNASDHELVWVQLASMTGLHP
jgi:endonuclease/exonuclease/phosphatase family metal-dependent hydrolase